MAEQNTNHLEYDPTDLNSILQYGQRLVGHAIQDFVPPAEITGRDKGRFGAYVEQYYGIARNSEAMADFETIGGTQLELKTVPLRRLGNGNLQFKEKLIFNIINFFNICDETWEDSSFLSKNRKILLVAFIDNPDEEIYEHVIYHVRILKLDEDIPHADFEQMQRDWENIVQLIQDGRAERLSERNTRILAAGTKGTTALTSYRAQPFSENLAKQRAFILKKGYLNRHLPLLLETANHAAADQGNANHAAADQGNAN